MDSLALFWSDMYKRSYTTSFTNRFFHKIVFLGLEEDKYTYDRKMFRIIDVCTSLLVTITLLVVYFTQIYWLLVLVGIYTIVLVFVTDAVVRKRKD